MNRALPDARVSGWEWMVDAINGLPDADDRHVVAAACHGQAAVIVTSNLKDFPDKALPGPLFAQDPDEFLLDLLDLCPTLVNRALVEITHRSGSNGPRWSVTDLLDRLEREGLGNFADAIRADESGAH